MLDENRFTEDQATVKAFAPNDGAPNRSGLPEQRQGMSPEDRILLLTHLENCRDCMAEFMDTLPEAELLPPPEGLTDRILGAVREEQRRKPERRAVRRAKIAQFVKLGIAVCLTMVMFYGVNGILGLRENWDLVQAPPYASPNTPAPPAEDDFWTDVARGFDQGFTKFADAINTGFRFEGDGDT